MKSLRNRFFTGSFLLILGMPYAGNTAFADVWVHVAPNADGVVSVKLSDSEAARARQTGFIPGLNYRVKESGISDRTDVIRQRGSYSARAPGLPEASARRVNNEYPQTLREIRSSPSDSHILSTDQPVMPRYPGNPSMSSRAGVYYYRGDSVSPPSALSWQEEYRLDQMIQRGKSEGSTVEDRQKAYWARIKKQENELTTDGRRYGDIPKVDLPRAYRND